MIKGLPEKLQELRAKYGYSQKQVADLIKVSPSVVSGYETGERTPSTDVLLQLANMVLLTNTPIFTPSSQLYGIIRKTGEV